MYQMGLNILSTVLILSAITMKKKKYSEIYFVEKKVALTSALQINMRCLLTHKISPTKASLPQENPPPPTLLSQEYTINCSQHVWVAIHKLTL